MPRLLKHPRCKDFFRASRNPMILESVTLSAKNSNLLSGNVLMISILKKFQILINLLNKTH